LKQEDFVGECSSVVIHFNNANCQHFWVWIVGRNKVIECNSVVVDIAKAMGNSQLTRIAYDVLSNAHLL
jgi:hypothetical protein